MHFSLPPLPQILLGLGLAILVSLLAYRLHSLSLGGALAAAGLGTVVFGLGGLGWAALLLGFFISSSGLSRLFKRRKAKYEEKFSKGSQRDAGQVLANGGVAGLFVILHLFFPGCDLALAGLRRGAGSRQCGYLGNRTGRAKPAPSAPADQLAARGTRHQRGSQPGRNAGRPGRFILDCPDRSLLLARSPVNWLLVFGITLAGLIGSLVDSYFGATVQAIYYCPACHKETERHPLHTCGTQTRQMRGLGWLDNDWVNTACTLAGGVMAAVLAIF